MKRTKRTLRLQERGSALALVLTGLVILLVMGTGLLGLGLQSQLTSIRAASEIAARSAADAGLTKALFEMNELLRVKAWDDSILPEATGETLPNCDATFSYTVTGDPDSGYAIESIGKSGLGEKTVSSILRLEGPFEYAIFANDSIDLAAGATVDWYNHDIGDENLQVGTNSTEASSVNLRHSATINGDVVVGAGGDPDVVINTQWATITGRTYAAFRNYELPAIAVPLYLQGLPSQGKIKDSSTISNSGKYEEVNLNNGKIITIDGPVTLYVIGDITLKNSAELQVVDASTNPDASLTLYLGGDIEVKNSGAVNNLSKEASKVKIYGLNSCHTIILKNGTDFHGAIYAPNADVEMMNSGEAFGSVVANSFEQKNSATFNYDASLRDVSIDDEAVHFEVGRWQEE